MEEPSERGLFAPAHRADGSEPAPDVWLRLELSEEVEEENEELGSGGKESMFGIT